MTDLDPKYTAETGRMPQDAWYGCIRQFEDASLYQTWAYDAVQYGSDRIAHMVLSRDGSTVAAAQARIVRLPLVGIGIAYVFWGPLWRRAREAPDVEVFRQALRALRHEFSLSRGLVLRLNPLAIEGRDDALRRILVEEGFGPVGRDRNRRTLIVDLSPPLGEIRASLDQKWRNCLNRSEKNNLEIIQGEDDALFDDLARIYTEMADRKGLADLADLGHLREAQKQLPADMKLRIVLCRENAQTCAGAIFSAVGDTGLYLVGATSNAGMRSKGSYLVQWAFVQWLKENKYRYYDLNGINPATNPGTYHFKKGLAGKLGQDVVLLGKYQTTQRNASGIAVGSGQACLSAYRTALRKIRSLRASPQTKAADA